MSNWILLRGLTRESRHWGDFPRTFGAAIPAASVVTLDLPGNGVLCTVRSPLSVDAMAQHGRTELLRRGIAPPYSVLALSLGAMVAVAWAARCPQDISRCVLINTSLRPFAPFYRRLRPANYAALLEIALTAGAAHAREETVLRLTSRVLHPASEPGMSILAEWIGYHREHPVSRANALRQLLAAARYRAPAAKPAVPMLVLASARDRLVDPRCSRALARAWNTGYAEHPTAGHDLPLDDGAWVAGQVRDWLGSAVPATGSSA